MASYNDLVKYFKGNKTLLSFNEEGIKDAIAWGCKDMTPRTMKKKVPGDNAISNLCSDLCGSHNYSGYSLLDHINKYFNNPAKNEKEFDKWHEEACEIIIQCLNNYYQKKSVTYGKAQKIINITMKNIFCLAGAEQKYKAGYFTYCHMVLDSFILEWVYRTIKYEYKTVKITRESLDRWSNLEKNPANPQKWSYQKIQEEIRKLHISGFLNGLTPFEAEFYIWKQMQQTLATEALFDPDIAGISTDDFKKKSLKDKLPILRDCIDGMDAASFYFI